MKCPECGQKHFKKDGILKVLRVIEPWKLVHDYLSVMTEIRASMQNDATNHRKGAFITSLRDFKECYFRGLWVGLMATPEEIIHDASGEKPLLTLVKLARRVSEAVFDEEDKLSATLPGPRKAKSKTIDVLDPSTHLTALFLLNQGLMSDAEAKHMYETVLKTIEAEAAHLRYVSGALKAGKKKKEIVHALRPLLKKTV